MRKQKEMVESFMMVHRDYMKNLSDCLDELEKDFKESKDIDDVCTGEWCKAIEVSLDEMAKDIYSISEPRWVSSDYSKTLRDVRNRLHDLYKKYQGVSSKTEH